MLIIDYLSSNIIICICFFDLTHFRAEIQKYFRSIFGSNQNFEINWPLRGPLLLAAALYPVEFGCSGEAKKSWRSVLKQKDSQCIESLLLSTQKASLNDL